MIQLIIDLMNLGVHVAIVTAAGYPGDAERFEQRVQGLLAAFRQQRLPDHITDRCIDFASTDRLTMAAISEQRCPETAGGLCLCLFQRQ